ncbi:MAG: hypothetical protein A3J83_01095 [Elusimicrobia bacterium RIFOXYA2_FULL_40_6]|nr:MAG: hypothetical protein A3J83_01095 [Elusimicrobia bacterium RIFOXYA2_FULL_40_6]
MDIFLMHLGHYVKDILPSILLGLLISGIVHELLPQSIIEKHLGNKGFLPLLYVIVIGMILPVCCFGSLPIAITFRKKGVSLGPVLAFLIATPATSITAILVTWKLMGLGFTIALCVSVVVMGFVIGIIGNFFETPEVKEGGDSCPMCAECSVDSNSHQHHKKGFFSKIVSVFTYAFIDLPREIGLELVIGILLAAVIASLAPVNYFINNYLSGFAGYIFALIFGIVMYICSTASVPLAHAFVQAGLSVGAGMVLLLAGPITSYGTILVVKKEFGLKILITYLTVISIMSLLAGITFSLLFNGYIVPAV